MINENADLTSRLKDDFCRNCLVSEGHGRDRLHVQLHDSALSKDFFPGDYHFLGDDENRPVKWMAYESLLHNSFNSSTDVVCYIQINIFYLLCIQSLAGSPDSCDRGRILAASIVIMSLPSSPRKSGFVAGTTPSPTAEVSNKKRSSVLFSGKVWKGMRPHPADFAPVRIHSQRRLRKPPIPSSYANICFSRAIQGPTSGTSSGTLRPKAAATRKTANSRTQPENQS